MVWLLSLILFSAPLIFALLRNEPLRKSDFSRFSSFYYIIIGSFWNLLTETTQRSVALFQLAIWLLSLWCGGKLLEQRELYLPEEGGSQMIVHPDTDWKCPCCGTVNDRFFTECKKCGEATKEPATEKGDLELL